MLDRMTRTDEGQDSGRPLTRQTFLREGASSLGLAAVASPLGARGQALAWQARQLAHRPLDASRPVSLRFMIRGGVGYTAYFKAAGNAFRRQHPNVTISYEAPSDFNTKLKVEMAGGVPPDLAFIGDDVMFSFAARGALLDLAPFFARAGLKRADYWPAAIDPQYLGPHLFALPLDYGVYVMYYNKALFDRQHLSYPTDRWSWADWVQTARHLTIDRTGKRASEAGFQPAHVTQYAEDGQLPYWFLPVLRSYGGDWATSQLTQARLDTPVAVRTFQWIADVGNRYHTSISPKYPTSQSFALEQGNVAMHFDGTWQNSTYPHYPALKWDQGTIDIAPFPKGTASRGTGAEASGLAIPAAATAGNVPWAWAFIKYMATEPGQRLAFRYGVASVPNTRALAHELIPTLTQPRNSRIMLDLLPQATLPYWSEAISDADLEALLQNPWSPAPTLRDLYLGRTTAARALPQVNASVQTLLDRDQQTAKRLGVTLHL